MVLNASRVQKARNHSLFGGILLTRANLRAKSSVQTMELIEPNAVVLQLPRASESLLEANSDEEMSEFSAAYKAAKQLEDCEVFFEDTPLIGPRNIKHERENSVLSKNDERFCELIRAAERVTVDKECKEIWSAVCCCKFKCLSAKSSREQLRATGLSVETRPGPRALCLANSEKQVRTGTCLRSPFGTFPQIKLLPFRASLISD